ncbi:MAG: GTP cyclohydrolase FolE2 [Bacteriovoracaceae bacterium]|nr:GTP cyclohydrolase FolE2 [Bacteriovoracaceae bacterium]
MAENTQTTDLALTQKVLNCEVQDSTGLNDFQKVPDRQGIAIPKVGINRFRVPLTFKHRDGSIMNHDCVASMYVNCPAGKTGINMSRLCSILQNESSHLQVNQNFFKTVLNRYRTDLRDYDYEEKLDAASLKIELSYPVKQLSLKSNNWGWQYYKTIVEAKETKTKGFVSSITLEYEYSSTCPCSLSMAKQYESDYAAGLTTEGNGIGVAHGQRSRATAKVILAKDAVFGIEDLIELLRTAIPTETQSLVKRIDEQAFAILNGSNPMFVEHASKRLYKVFNQDARITDWIVSLEHFESLHSHNACAVINKGIEDGLAESPVL